MVFNILIGNTDDHAKNHAFFWDGHYFSLTPAYDVCPYPRVGQETHQSMIVGEFGALSNLKNVKSAAKWFGLSALQSDDLVTELVDQVKKYWPYACDYAELTKTQQNQLTGSAVLNPFCFY